MTNVESKIHLMRRREESVDKSEGQTSKTQERKRAKAEEEETKVLGDLHSSGQNLKATTLLHLEEEMHGFQGLPKHKGHGERKAKC